jgi:hypothetical protein
MAELVTARCSFSEVLPRPAFVAVVTAPAAAAVVVEVVDGAA